ncbi:hypothetical protein GCM10010254_72510 [Streptomyces chromofuscus]|nr:hypothetical protein GCM10010254_72510 [Streptomyces chromofuscus]
MRNALTAVLSGLAISVASAALWAAPASAADVNQGSDYASHYRRPGHGTGRNRAD